jgi:hypothetical protein
MLRAALAVLLFGLLTGCTGQGQASPALAAPPATTTVSVVAVSATRAPVFTPTPSPEATELAAATVTATAASTRLPTRTPTRTATPDPQAWQKLPVVPTVSERARAIYQHGLDLGNNPRTFSKVGDCESQAVWFLTDFDSGPAAYTLGDYAGLQDVIDYFKGSYERLSQAAKPSFNAASLMTAMWADPAACQKDETPLACEFRLNRPAVALVMLGTNDSPRPETFEANMRKIIDFSIERGVLPVLATKADNLEGNGRINATIARLAQEYDIPLWNYWASVQSIPQHGLQEDGAHLTLGPNRFDDPQALKTGWAVRNLTALQVLDAVWKGVSVK